MKLAYWFVLPIAGPVKAEFKVFWKSEADVDFVVYDSKLILKTLPWALRNCDGHF